jgi:flagellar hook-basal body complex protein FliE
MPIDPLTLSSGGASVTALPKPGADGDGAGFQNTLSRLIDGIEQTSADANAKVSGMMEKTVDVHDAMIALQREELTLQLSLAIRNKFVTAYQEIMRMPI